MRTLRQPLDHRLEQLLGGPLTGNFQKKLCQRLKLRPVIRRQLHANRKELPAELSDPSSIPAYRRRATFALLLLPSSPQLLRRCIPEGGARHSVRAVRGRPRQACIPLRSRRAGDCPPYHQSKFTIGDSCLLLFLPQSIPNLDLGACNSETRSWNSFCEIL